MLDDDELMRRYQARKSAGVFNATSEQSQQPQKKKKNFWLDQISTVGGIVGGIGGSLIAPIAGTAGGAGLGSSLGEALENAITGDSLGKNVVKEGALGAVFGAGPIKLLKGGAALAAGKGIQGASQAALTPLRRKAGQALIGASDDLAVKQFRLTPNQLNNFKQKFGEDASQTIKKYGFQNADDITVKGIEPLQQQFDEAIGGITGVTKDSLKQSLMNKIVKLNNAGPSDMKAMGASLRRETNDLLKGFGDVIDAKELNIIRRQFDDLVNYTEKVTNPSRYGVNKRMADSIRETLQSADPSGGLKGIGRELQKLRQLSDNALKQSQVGRGSSPISIGNIPGTIMGAGAGIPGAAVGYAANAAANSPLGRRVMATGADKVGNRLLNQGLIGQTKRGIAGRVGASAILRSGQPESDSLEDALVNNYSLENSSTNPMVTNTNANIPNSVNINQQYQTPGNMSSNLGAFSPEQVAANAQQILAQGGDFDDVKDYIDLATALQEMSAPAQAKQKPLSQGQQERTDLINALGLTEQALEGGSINYGPIGSRIEGIKSYFNAADPETLAFKNTVSGLRAAITKARAGASLTAGELKMLSKYTPSETDTEQVVRSKLQQLRNLYGYNAPTGGGTLEDTLMQYAGSPAYQ